MNKIFIARKQNDKARKNLKTFATIDAKRFCETQAVYYRQGAINKTKN